MAQLDLSTLPPPQVVEELSFEAILAEIKADLIDMLPEIEPTLALESTVVSKLLQVAAYREIKARARINDQALSLLLARAVGADLDNRAADFGVARLVVTPATEGSPAVMESDDRLRRRVLLAIDAYSVAGPEGAYIYHALTTIPSLRDATAISPQPGRVLVTIMGSIEEPEPSAEDRAKVALALSAKTVRPLTDMVSVASPNILSTPIVAELTIYPGPDGNVVAANARARLEAWLAEVAYLGRSLHRSAISSRLHVDGVRSVDLISPAQDLIIGKREVVQIDGVTITIAGANE